MTQTIDIRQGQSPTVITPEIVLTEDRQQELAKISQLTGKSQQQLITLAIEELIKKYQHQQRLTLIQSAKGIWRDRDDLPNISQIRQEFNRN